MCGGDTPTREQVQVLTWRSGALMMRPERSRWENKMFYLKRHGTLTNEDDLRLDTARQ